MKAAVLYEINTPLKIEEFDLPDTGPNQVRVRIVASGVCHSDWHVVKGDWPHIPIPTILGHEGAGIVEEVGTQVTGVSEGDHVILSWKRSCGYCEMCQKGFPTLCELPPDSSTLPRFPGEQRTMEKMAGLGTFGTHALVPQDAVVSIDKDMPFAQAALIGCGVMTGSWCSDQYRSSAGWEFSGGLRLWGRGAQLHSGCSDSGCRANHRGRCPRQQARDGKAFRRD